MARQEDRAHHPETTNDVWSNAWGDPALQALGGTLVGYGVTAEHAAVVVEQIWLFYSYEALPFLGERLPMGIATRNADRPAVWIYLPFRAPQTPITPLPTESPFRQLNAVFKRKLEVPLADIVTMDLERVLISFDPGLNDVWAPQRFEDRVRAVAARRQSHVVGVFVDDLVAELRTVMEPEAVPLWLETPNTVFAGRKPIELLNDPHDQQLRDVITRAKFNLPAA